MNGDLTALDMALAPSFFISYSVLALIQLNALFARAYVRYVVLVGIVGALMALFVFNDWSAACAEPLSAIICNNDGAGLVGFGWGWAAVSAGALAMYLFTSALIRWRESRGG